MGRTGVEHPLLRRQSGLLRNREHFPDQSIDLIYLDPPFNSNASYNVLFKGPSGKGSGAQIEAFEDTWHWGEAAEDAFDQTMQSGHVAAADMLRAMRGFLGENDMMAYLAMMAIRLIELRRVLRSTGSLYLHCDPTASHYLKVLLDGVFGAENYRSEIIWKRSTSHGNTSRAFGDLTDTILYYSRNPAKYVWNQQFVPFTADYIEKYFRWSDPNGRRWQSVTLRNPGVRPNLHFPFTASNGITYQPHPNGWSCDPERLSKYDSEGRLHYPDRPDGQLRLKMYLDESPGVRLQNLWDDIPAVNSQARERLGYPTQKPVQLLERIIATSSNPNEIILDPFCGCGTAVHAAQKLGRQWLGIDITHLAISLIERRLRDAFPGIKFDVHGTPKDIDAARDLAGRDRYQFQWWAVSLVNAQPYGGKKKGADTGIDGKVFFKPDGRRTEVAIVSVKSGGVGVTMIRELKSVIEREKAPMGLFLTLSPPTDPMRVEATAAGFYETLWGKHPRIQILTIAELLDGKRPDMPLIDVGAAFRAAPREMHEGDQQELTV
jgi:site-specific DNA-methyltransferase (adenine-specific)